MPWKIYAKHISYSRIQHFRNDMTQFKKHKRIVNIDSNSLFTVFVKETSPFFNNRFFGLQLYFNILWKIFYNLQMSPPCHRYKSHLFEKGKLELQWFESFLQNHHVATSSWTYFPGFPILLSESTKVSIVKNWIEFYIAKPNKNPARMAQPQLDYLITKFGIKFFKNRNLIWYAARMKIGNWARRSSFIYVSD